MILLTKLIGSMRFGIDHSSYFGVRRNEEPDSHVTPLVILRGGPHPSTGSRNLPRHLLPALSWG
jgi:hypothetical protein